MDTLRESLSPKTFNRISYVAVVCWILFGVILLGTFAEMENSDSFRCEAKFERMDLVRVKCSDQYKKQYNKSGVPLYGFVITNFSLTVIVCVIYSQVANSRVDELLTDNRRRDAEGQNNDRNRPKRRKLFVAYFCQLAIRFLLGIVFIVLQTQLLYPANFPSDFHCQISGGSHAANTSSTGNIQNSTMYECHNQQATKKTFWMYAVIVGNGLLALIILIEIICIFALRAKKGKEFLEDSQFLADYLPPQETPQEPEQRASKQEIPLLQIDSEEQQLQQPSLIEFIERLKKRIMKSTEKPPGLKAPFQIPGGEGKRNKDLKIDSIYTNLFLIRNRAYYDVPQGREEQRNMYPEPNKKFQPIRREEIADAETDKTILVVGRPGIGKTLFCEKLVRNWASDKAVLHAGLRFDVVFFLKFRTFNSGENLSLRELLERSEYLPSECLNDKVWSYILGNPNKVLMVFDGVDEFSGVEDIAMENNYRDEQKMPLSALYGKIAKGKLLPGATVLTTTRPTVVSKLDTIDFNKIVEILGFASEQVQEYATKFTKDTPEEVKDAGKNIWEHINSSTGVGLPTEITKIYQRVTEQFLYKHDQQHHDKPLEETRGMNEKFKRLAKIAFDGLKQGKLIFGSNEVSEDLTNSPFIHRLPDYLPEDDPKRVAQYLTIQKFLAAKHITDTMKGAELRKFVADHINKGEWQVVMQFVAGLLGDGDEQSIDIFTDLLLKTTEEKDESLLMVDDSVERRTVTCWPTHSEKHLALTLLKCLYENNASNSIVQSKLEEIGVNAVDFSNCRLAPADCTAVVHFLKSFKQISLINLSDNNIGPLGCVEIVKLFDNGSCNLSSLNLGLNNITDQGIKHLCKALEQDKCNLRSLNLMSNNITEESMKHLCKALVNNNKLRRLNLRWNPEITNKGKKQIRKANLNCEVLI